MRTFNTHKIHFFRRGENSIVDGEYVSSADKSLGFISGSLQPLTQGVKEGVSVGLQSSGVDSSSRKVFRTKTKLRTASIYKKTQCDYCKLEDGVYDVTQESDWNICGFNTKHYVYILSKLPEL